MDCFGDITPPKAQALQASISWVSLIDETGQWFKSRCADNPLVIGGPHIRCHARVPLTVPGGHAARACRRPLALQLDAGTPINRGTVESLASAAAALVNFGS